ncbi:MAG: M20/M25/M40 family metallo-hydrolase [Bryobacteraceae bacterium]|nr:M20/M25/M40 family metallo-hydrolase [Bryobacteraceae bacterium]
MDVVALTRALVDIESITENEEAVGEFLYTKLRELADRSGGIVEKLEVAPRRFNVLATWGTPVVTLSTHMDTVPPFFASSEDASDVWGRGACDTKGIIAAMIKAAEALVQGRVQNFGVLIVVGEERNSVGAYAAGRDGRGARFLINGEPTSNKLALGSKGCLRYEVIARGKMAHSAYPELGESAINKLMDALAAMRAMPMPTDPVLGAATLNVGTISGGRAPNVVADHANAQVIIRIVDDGESCAAASRHAVGDLAELKEVLRLPAVHLGTLDGFETTVVAYTTDIPAFGTAWGQPFLLGPGTIHVAHTAEERVPKSELYEAEKIYEQMVRRLLTT